MDTVRDVVKKRLHTVEELMGIGYSESEAQEIYDKRLERETRAMNRFRHRVLRLMERGINTTTMSEIAERALSLKEG